MSHPIVLITFYSRCGSTEKLAMTAAVGVTQARAHVRLRRLSDANPEEFSACKETIDRMRKEYVPPAEPDIVSADAIIFGIPSDFTVSSPEWTRFMDLLHRLHSEGKVAGKVAAIVSPVASGERSGAALMSFTASIIELGLIFVPSGFGRTPRTTLNPADHALAHGRKVAAITQALQQAIQGHIR